MNSDTKVAWESLSDTFSAIVDAKSVYALGTASRLLTDTAFAETAREIIIARNIGYSSRVYDQMRRQLGEMGVPIQYTNMYESLELQKIYYSKPYTFERSIV